MKYWPFIIFTAFSDVDFADLLPVPGFPESPRLRKNVSLSEYSQMEEEDQHFGAYESSYENKDTVNSDTQQGVKISSI